MALFLYENEERNSSLVQVCLALKIIRQTNKKNWKDSWKLRRWIESGEVQEAVHWTGICRWDCATKQSVDSQIYIYIYISRSSYGFFWKAKFYLSGDTRPFAFAAGHWTRSHKSKAASYFAHTVPATHSNTHQSHSSLIWKRPGKRGELFVGSKQ